MNEKINFFEFAAEVGLTKHLGGMEATDKIIALCGITESSYVLDVGCGTGMTACYLAKKCGCRVVGVDIVPGMIERSQENAKRAKVANLVEFKVGDAQKLSFEDARFDVVFTESVIALVPDQQKALLEIVRVLKPGGYVVLNESTWLQSPQPQEMVDWVSGDLGATAKPLTPDEYIHLMENVGLTDVTSDISAIDIKDEAKGLIQRYGGMGIIRVLWRTLILYLRSPEYRNFVKEVKDAGVTPDGIEEFFGYGLYAGIKAGV